MFRSFTVDRFRGLARCHVQGMRRITLLTGKNNAGKTALLEAMFIHAGRYNPHLMMVVNALRGVSKVRFENTPDSDAPWKSSFTGYDDSMPIRFVAEVQTKSGQYEEVAMTISAVRNDVELRGLGSQLRGFSNMDVATGPTKVLKLELTEGKRTKAKSQKNYLVFHDKGQVVIPTPQSPEQQARLIQAHQRDNAETLASQFAQFQVNGQVGMLVDALRPMEPRLKELTLMFVGEPMLHGDIGLSERRLIPLALMGDGISRVAALVLGIGSTAGGTVLVDDIDTGLHHSVMEQFWDTVFKAATLFNVQVVATTHSDECAKAALGSALASKRGEDFCLVRLERRGAEVASISYAASELEVAFDAELEVR